MPRQENRSSYSRRQDSEARSSRKQDSIRRERGGRSTRRQQSTSYHPILQIFAVDKGDRISLNIKPIATEKQSIEDVMSLEEWLFFCEQVYNGEKGYTFAGSLWESSIPQADWTGNIRLSDEQLETLQEDFENARGKQKKKPAKGKPASKPKYEVPEDDEEEDYEEADEEASEDDASEY